MGRAGERHGRGWAAPVSRIAADLRYFTRTSLSGLRTSTVTSVVSATTIGVALVLVGALNVAAIETVWAGLVTPPRSRRTQHREYTDVEAIQLDKGAEMGRFNMGSTVILVSHCSFDWDQALRPGAVVRMGERLASRGARSLRTA